MEVEHTKSQSCQHHHFVWSLVAVVGMFVVVGLFTPAILLAQTIPRSTSNIQKNYNVDAVNINQDEQNSSQPSQVSEFDQVQFLKKIILAVSKKDRDFAAQIQKIQKQNQSIPEEIMQSLKKFDETFEALKKANTIVDIQNSGIKDIGQNIVAIEKYQPQLANTMK